MSKHIRIWSFADVDRSGKVRWAAQELGYEIEEVRVKPGEHAKEPYRKLNPYEQIPAAELKRIGSDLLARYYRAAGDA